MEREQARKLRMAELEKQVKGNFAKNIKEQIIFAGGRRLDMKLSEINKKIAIQSANIQKDVVDSKLNFEAMKQLFAPT